MCIAFILVKLFPKLIQHTSRRCLILLFLVLAITSLFLATYTDVAISYLPYFHFDPPNSLALERDTHPGTRYLTYVPHSGLPSQHSQFSNALLLASYLNRTLALPPAILGEAPTWHPYPNLLRLIGQLVAFNWATICKEARNGPSEGWESFEAACLQDESFTIVPWSSLYDLKPLSPYVRIVEHRELSLPIMLSELGISHENLYMREDTEQYEWMVYDSPELPAAIAPGTGPQYKTAYTVDYFLALTHRLLHMYGAGGEGRVTATTPEHLQLKQLIGQTFMASNPTLERAADQIMQFMGGEGTYVGVYVTINDDVDIASAVEQVLELAELADIHSDIGEEGVEAGNCIRGDAAAHSGKYIPLFVVTDVEDPRYDQAMRQLFVQFPCAVTMWDVPEVMEVLDEMIGTYEPEKRMGKFLASVVGWIVARKGWRFIERPK